MENFILRSVVAERGVKTPTEPIVFLKPSTSYITQGQEIKVTIKKLLLKKVLYRTLFSVQIKQL